MSFPRPQWAAREQASLEIPSMLQPSPTIQYLYEFNTIYINTPWNNHKMELFNVSNGPDLTFMQTSPCQDLILEQRQFFKKSRHDFGKEPYSMNLKNKLKHVRQKVFNKHVRIMIHYRGIWLIEARSQMLLGKGKPNRITYTLTKGSYECEKSTMIRR